MRRSGTSLGAAKANAGNIVGVSNCRVSKCRCIELSVYRIVVYRNVCIEMSVYRIVGVSNCRVSKCLYRNVVYRIVVYRNVGIPYISDYKCSIKRSPLYGQIVLLPLRFFAPSTTQSYLILMCVCFFVLLPLFSCIKRGKKNDFHYFLFT